MENINFGIVKTIVINKIKNNFINENSFDKSKKISNDFFSIIKESPILHKQFIVYNNLENTKIDDDHLITKFINENIAIFNDYKSSKIINENKKIKKFLDEDALLINKEKNNLYEAINNLITSNDSFINIKENHESFSILFNHIKNKKKEKSSNNSINEYNDDIIKIAINKFNKKYSSLNEEDKKILNLLSTETEANKKKYFESLKKETLNLLESINDKNIKNKIDEALDKINGMNYNTSSIIKNTLSLYELKNNLIPKKH